MKVFEVSKGKPEGAISDEDQRKFEKANTIFVECILSIRVHLLCGMYMHITDGKELWHALNANYSQQMLAMSCISWRDFMIIRW
jgi:hypothetical protein